MNLLETHNKIENAKQLNFGDVLSECIELFKKVWVQGLLAVLLIALFSVPLVLISSFILEILGLAVENIFDPTDLNIESLIAFYNLNALYNIPLTLFTSVIQIAFLGAFYRIVNNKDLENNINEDYFYFFKQEYVTKLFMLGLIHTAISTIAQLLCFVPYIYVVVPLMYFSIIFAFNSEKSVEEIIKISFLIGNKKWGLSFGTLIISGIIGFLGVIACFIGVLFTISIVYLPAYIIYKHVIGFEEDSEILKIGTE